MQQNRRGGSRWIGWLLFIFVVFGSRFLPPVATWLTQVTGLPISAPILVTIVVVFGVIANVVSSVITESNKGGAGQMRLPTDQSPLAPPPSAPPLLQSGPPFANPGAGPRLSLPSDAQRLPSPPSFEPILNPRIVVIGLVGLGFVGGCFFLILRLVGVL